MGHRTLWTNQGEDTLLIDTRHITNTLDSRGTRKQVSSASVWKLQSVSLSLSLSTVNLWLFVVWGKPENISWADFTSKRPIKQHRLASCWCSLKSSFSAAMHTLLVKVRIEVHFFFMWNLSILCLLIVCKYHIRSPEAKLKYFATFLHVSSLASHTWIT